MFLVKHISQHQTPLLIKRRSSSNRCNRWYRLRVRLLLRQERLQSAADQPKPGEAGGYQTEDLRQVPEMQRDPHPPSGLHEHRDLHGHQASGRGIAESRCAREQRGQLVQVPRVFDQIGELAGDETSHLK